MITKERLEELIKQGATIYYINYYTYGVSEEKIRTITLNENYFIKNKRVGNTLMFKTAIGDDTVLTINQFYETKEDACWDLEMTATRTETLKMPKYEDFKNGQTIHFNCYPCDYECSTDLVNIYIREFFGFGGKDLYIKPLTKENYLEACELCKKLFLGESEDDR